MALLKAVTHIIFVKGMLKDAFNVKLNDPVKIYVENSGALTVAKFVISQKIQNTLKYIIL